MAKSALGILELRTTGNDANGGGFKAGASGTDYSQQDSPQVTIDNSTIICTTTGAASNTLTFVSGYTPSAADVGNWTKLAGTNVNTGWYEITAIDATLKTWTVTGESNLTTGVGAGAAITGRMGGALLTVSGVESAAVNGNFCWVKAGTYAFAAGVTGTRTFNGNIANCYEGYQTTRGDLGTKPIWQITASSVTIFTRSGGFNTKYNFRNIAFDGNSQTAGHAFSGSNYFTGHLNRCTFTGFTGTILNDQATTLVSNCDFNGAAGGAANAAGTVHWVDCTFHGFTTTVITLGGNCSRCLFYDCTGSTTDAITQTASQTVASTIENCTFKNIGRRCINMGTVPTNSNAIVIRNCLFYLQQASSVGIRLSNSTAEVLEAYCAYYLLGAGSAAVSGTLYASVGRVTLSADPFVDNTNNNLALNSAAGGGAACKSVGNPGTFQDGLTTGYLDIGAVQSAGGGALFMRRGLDGGMPG